MHRDGLAVVQEETKFRSSTPGRHLCTPGRQTAISYHRVAPTKTRDKLNDFQHNLLRRRLLDVGYVYRNPLQARASKAVTGNYARPYATRLSRILHRYEHRD